MTPMNASILAWLGGGIVGLGIGSALPKSRPVVGFVVGALLIGAISDKLIETHHPWYTGRFVES